MDQPHPSYSRGSQDKSLLAMTIGQAFDHTVAQYPDGEALVVRHQQRRYTWRQLAEAESVESGPRMVNDQVTDDDIAAVVAAWTGIPVDKLTQGETEKLLTLDAVDVFLLIASAASRIASSLPMPWT